MLEDVFRDQWGRVLATLVGVLGDIELAEDAAQEAFALAAERWPRDGEPENPIGWLITTGRNRAIDRIRRDRTLARKTEQLGRELREEPEEPMDDRVTLPDERLELIFTCCHPALAARRAGGADAAHARRPVDRGRRRRVPRAVRDDEQAADPRQAQDPPGGHPLRRAARHVLPERLDAVLAVLYLVFNQGWGGGHVDLASEAIRLGRVLATLMPDESEVLALLALMLINDARRDARFHDGRLVLLDDQDRSLWNARQIADGRALLERASRCAGRGRTSCRRRSPTSTSASRATGRRSPALRRAEPPHRIAGRRGQPRGRDRRDCGARGRPRDPRRLDLDAYRYLHSTRAALLRRLGRDDEARVAYERALELTDAGPEQRFLAMRLAELPDA